MERARYRVWLMVRDRFNVSYSVRISVRVRTGVG